VTLQKSTGHLVTNAHLLLKGKLHEGEREGEKGRRTSSPDGSPGGCSCRTPKKEHQSDAARPETHRNYKKSQEEKERLGKKRPYVHFSEKAPTAANEL